MNSEFHVPNDYHNGPPSHPVKGYAIELGDFWASRADAPCEGRIIQNRSVKPTSADALHAHLEVRNDRLIDNHNMLDEIDEALVRERNGIYVIDPCYRLAPCTITTSFRAHSAVLHSRRRNTESHIIRRPPEKLHYQIRTIRIL
jgi:hypothetical protein